MESSPSPDDRIALDLQRSRRERIVPTTTGDLSESRSEFRRDRDRILYSVEFQRLVGVTQVASPNERFPVHNRLTHTLKVAQVGRSIAERLISLHAKRGIAAQLDPDVVEAACLAHDLGHPPFGHNTEVELDALLTDGRRTGDGFEGNAQTFRIVTRTAVKYPQHLNIEGLNLTAATLNAVLKYPWAERQVPESKRKWGYYESESDLFAFARARCGFADDDRTPGLEASVMNLADDISYAVHDVEDFVRAGLIPSDVFVHGSVEQSEFLTSAYQTGASDLIDRARDVLGFLALQRFHGTSADFAKLAQFRSYWVDRFITSVAAAYEDGHWTLSIPDDIRFEIEVLQHLTRYFVIDSPSVQGQRYGQRKVIRDLFTIMTDEALSHRFRIFPPIWRERLSISEPAGDSDPFRTIADYIASMTENQVVDTFQKLTGFAQGSITDPLL